MYNHLHLHHLVQDMQDVEGRPDSKKNQQQQAEKQLLIYPVIQKS